MAYVKGVGNLRPEKFKIYIDDGWKPRARCPYRPFFIGSDGCLLCRYRKAENEPLKDGYVLCAYKAVNDT